MSEPSASAIPQQQREAILARLWRIEVELAQAVLLARTPEMVAQLERVRMQIKELADE